MNINSLPDELLCKLFKLCLLDHVPQERFDQVSDLGVKP